MTLPVRALTLPTDRPARIAVVADTHSRPDPRALALIAARAPDVVLHAGDIGDLAVLDALRPLAPTLVAVRGNIDAAAHDVPEALRLRFERDGREVMAALLLHIAVAGPRLRAEVRRLAERERCDVVVCGHSHVPFAARDGGLVVFNPGSIGPRRFDLPIVFGWLELGDRLSVAHVDCTTGAPWRPPVSATM